MLLKLNEWTNHVPTAFMLKLQVMYALTYIVFTLWIINDLFDIPSCSHIDPELACGLLTVIFLTKQQLPGLKSEANVEDP